MFNARNLKSHAIITSQVEEAGSGCSTWNIMGWKDFHELLVHKGNCLVAVTGHGCNLKFYFYLKKFEKMDIAERKQRWYSLWCSISGYQDDYVHIKAVASASFSSAPVGHGPTADFKGLAPRKQGSSTEKPSTVNFLIKEEFIHFSNLDRQTGKWLRTNFGLASDLELKMDVTVYQVKVETTIPSHET